MSLFRLLSPAALALAAGLAAAQPAPVTVVAPWVRATVQGQTSTGAFMTLTARETVSLVAISSPAAGAAELHEMKLDGDVMRMRAIDQLELPARQSVPLRPGGYHVMLTNLKAPLQPGAVVPMVMTFRTAKGEQRQLNLQVPVATSSPANELAPAAPAGGMGGMSGMPGMAHHGSTAANANSRAP